MTDPVNPFPDDDGKAFQEVCAAALHEMIGCQIPGCKARARHRIVAPRGPFRLRVCPDHLNPGMCSGMHVMWLDPDLPEEPPL